ncbi:MAG: DUF2961 domain-containing protein [Nitrospirae bacterium]|nr:DUF2961 domain-containing protein [Nitrospirota bacterium]
MRAGYAVGIELRKLTPILLLSACTPDNGGADKPYWPHAEKGPTGLQAFEAMDALPRVRRGVRAVEFSSYDRQGYNDNGFTGTEEFLYLDSEGATVLMDAVGPGSIQSMFIAWWNTGVTKEIEQSILAKLGHTQIFLDGSASPTIDLPPDAFFDKKHSPFLAPFVFGAEESGLGTSSYLPIPFRESILIRQTAGPQPMFFYQIWTHRYRDAEGVATFTGTEPRPEIPSLGPLVGSDPKSTRLNERTDGTISLQRPAPGREAARGVIFEMTGGGRIQSLRLKPRSSDDSTAVLRRRIWIEMEWDGRPGVEAPLAHFFAVGHRQTSTDSLPLGAVVKEVPVRSLMVGETDSGELYSYFPMPFARSARIEVSYRPGEGDTTTGAPVKLDYAIEFRPLLPEERPGETEGYFMTQYRSTTRSSSTDRELLGRDYVLLQTEGTGHYVGTVILANDTQETVLEGDERVYVDGSLTPQVAGTATECYFQGSWYFGENPYSLPFQGAPVIILREGKLFGRFDLTMYRFHLTDFVPFSRSIRFGIQHGGINNVPINYSSLAFYYALPFATLSLTDEVDVGKADSEAAHGYSWGGDAGAAPSMTAYYEGDRDGSVVEPYVERSLADSTPGEAMQLNLTMIGNPPTTPPPMESPEAVADDGRYVTSPYSVKVTVDPANRGVRLRRRFDQEMARQRALVRVDGHDAGIWYYAGGNPHKRWRDDDFEIPPELTRDKGTLTIDIQPLSEAWNEYYLWVFSHL